MEKKSLPDMDPDTCGFELKMAFHTPKIIQKSKMI